MSPFEILRCPESRSALKSEGDRLVSADGRSYPVIDGIARFLDASSSVGVVSEFYENEGWKRDASGLYGDTRAFVDTRDVPLAFTRKCIRRLNKHFHGGSFLLDAGSGPIAHDEYLEFGANFEYRICVDLSTQALQAARGKLGARGVYLQASLTSLPIESEMIDAVTCNHVIYQIPPAEQADAFTELWRVLKPGGVAVVIYWWQDTPLQWRLERLARLFAKRADEGNKPAASSAALNHFPRSVQWFEKQDWPFSYTIESFRVIGNAFMRSYVSNDWKGRLFLKGVYALQQVAPDYCGRYGQMAAIILRKKSPGGSFGVADD
jgi:ubiquinone/menaquinone biosynthesis C-methylase UbiE